MSEELARIARVNPVPQSPRTRLEPQWRKSDTPTNRQCRSFPAVGTFRSLVARIAHSASFYHRSGRAARQTSAVLIKDPTQIHFQRRVCDLENFASELAEAFGLGDGVGAL
jgi:hypothetical protein